jgi:CubicO group peptidase (beta-lactamase class C family)
LKEFTKIQYPKNENRRGLGFDKPLIGNATLSIEEAYPAPEVSPESFGHSGFTGTFVWADPINNLVFIFLSNRVYPSRDHKNIYHLNIRPKLQQVFYKAIKNKK